MSETEYMGRVEIELRLKDMQNHIYLVEKKIDGLIKKLEGK